MRTQHSASQANFHVNMFAGDDHYFIDDDFDSLDILDAELHNDFHDSFTGDE